MSSQRDKKIDVEYVAKLARLALTKDELKRLEEQLNDILEYIGKLNSLDVREVGPTSHPLPLSNVQRDDVVRPSLPVDEALKNAPQKEAGSFKVPKVIE